MTQRDNLDRLLTTWLDDPYTPPAPHYLGRVLERTRQTRQRPAWASLERWIPMADKVLQRPAAPPLRAAWLLIIALLLVALATAAMVVGSRLLAPSLVIPRGGSAVFVFGSIIQGASGQTGGDIFLARANGTDVRQLTSGPGIKSSPTWSPDGTRIAYRVWEAGNESIVMIDSGGGHKTTLATASSASDCARGVTWSPDGTSLIFPTSALCDGRFELLIVPTDGSSQATRLLAPGLEGLHADWSPDASRFAFHGNDGTGADGYYIVDAGPEDALRGGLQARRIVASGQDREETAIADWWSPDGTKLALASDGDIVVVDPDGSEPQVIARTAFGPAWSPDGKRIAFHRNVDPAEYFQDRPCTARIWVVDADGTNERRLDPLVEGCAPPPVWSPDGTRLAGLLIVATPDDPNLGFHYGVISVDGSDLDVALQDGGAGSWQPVVAPIPPAPSFAAPASTP